MTRKDFRLIAAAVNRAYHGKGSEGAMYTAIELANALEAAFPMFDRQRFLFACAAPEKQSEN